MYEYVDNKGFLSFLSLIFKLAKKHKKTGGGGLKPTPQVWNRLDYQYIPHFRTFPFYLCST